MSAIIRRKDSKQQLRLLEGIIQTTLLEGSLASGNSDASDASGKPAARNCTWHYLKIYTGNSENFEQNTSIQTATNTNSNLYIMPCATLDRSRALTNDCRVQHRAIQNRPYLAKLEAPEALDWCIRILSARSSFLAWFWGISAKSLEFDGLHPKLPKLTVCTKNIRFGI